MKEIPHQGDILKLENFNLPVLVVSKDYFNMSGEIVGCPIFKENHASPLHIRVEANKNNGFVQCEKSALLDLNTRDYSITGRIHMQDIIEITDAIQGIFDYI
jgi:mRNA-degrading endonuclease toxin of MazEF toxin-antitoxin module